MLKGEWRQHILLWSWTAIYFIWQSLQYNPTMRYQLPVYPLLAMMAAWLVYWLWDRRRLRNLSDWKLAVVTRLSSVMIGVLVLAADRGLCLCLQPHLRPPGNADRRLGLDLPERPGTDQPASPDTATGTTAQQPLPFST